MSTPVPLPALGESVTEGTVSRWLKQIGDQVAADEPLVEISTDKVDTEVPSPVAGVLLEIVVPEDGVAAVGATLAIIGDAAEVPAEAAAPAAPAMPTAPAMPAAPTLPASPAATSMPTAPAMPAAAMPAAPTLPASPAATSMPTAPAMPAAPAAQTPAAQAAAAPTAGGPTTNIVLPQLGESVTEGTISRWLKQVGEAVTADEALVEVSTDKVDTEIPAPASGVLVEIRVAEDAVAAVGAVLGVIGAEGTAATPAAAEAPATPQAAPAPDAPAPAAPAPAPVQTAPAPAPAAPAAPTPATPATPAAAAAPRASESTEVYVTPLVRKMAEANGVDLSTVTGTGVGGRIRKQDVLAAAEAKKAASGPAAAPAASSANAAVPPSPDAGKRGTTEQMSRLRATIASRMVDSLKVSAQLTATVEVDLTNIAKLRAKVKDGFRAREGVGLTFLAFIAKAATEALKHYPRVNATINTEAGTVSYAEAEHLGIAVDTERGLLVPVIAHAGNLNVTGLANKIADLAARTRTNKITPDELSGGTFTITNYGSAGTLFDTPIINQPQVAILGTGAVVRRPMVITDPKQGEMIAIRDMMYLSLTYDHRLVDGAEAARFLSMVKNRLEEGDFGSELGL